MKKSRAVIYLSTILLVVLIGVQAISFPSFADYCARFGKNYDREEYETREQIYQSNIEGMKTITGYTPGVNQFTDQRPSEIASTQVYYSEMKVLKTEEHEKSHIVAAAHLKVQMPESKDWRDQGVITSIKDQGACGSCWTFAGAAYAESKLLIEKVATGDINLSEQYLL